MLTDGFYPVFSGLYTGAGWLSVGGGYRQHILNQAGRRLHTHAATTARVDI